MNQSDLNLTAIKKSSRGIQYSVEKEYVDPDVDIRDYVEKKIDPLSLTMQTTTNNNSQEIEDEKEDDNHADHVSHLFV